MDRIEQIEQLFRANYSRMYAYAAGILKDDSLAADIVQDVFAEMLQHKAEERGTGYLLRSLRNRCLNELRHIAVRERIEKNIRLDSDPTDTDVMEREKKMAEITRLLREEMPEPYATTILLRFEKEMSYDEIARHSDITKVTVYRHLCKGIEFIRKHITC